MGLIANQTLNTGITVENAYHRIIGIKIDDLRSAFSISVGVWKDEDSRLSADKNTVHSESFRFPLKHEELQGETIYAYAYSKLKLLEVYKTAKDV